MNSNLKFYILRLVATLLCIVTVLPLSAQIADEYVTLKKFLGAKMYGEAYNEILRYEITRDRIDPGLQKLRVDILEKTKEQMLKQAKVNPDDPAVFTILADIAFQQSDFDNALSYISKALDIKSAPLSNYVCAKILFRRGNIDSAFDRMGNVLESMPDSQVVFEDFQFLYSCKNYGQATAAKICKNSNFLLRATPAVAPTGPAIPVSPFENDPTQVAVNTTVAPNVDLLPPMEYTPKEDDDDSEILPDEVEPSDDISLEDDPFSDFDDDSDIEVPDPMGKNKPQQVVSKPVEDNSNRKDAEVLAEKARRSFERKDYQLARDEYKTALQLYPKLIDKDGTKKRIDDYFLMIEKFKEAMDYFEMGSLNRAEPLLEEVYRHDPEKYRSAAYYLGRIYLTKENPDYDKALKYFDIVINDKTVESDFIREAEWIKLQVLYEKGDFKEADRLFKYFEKEHSAFIKNKDRYGELYRGISYHLYKFWMWGGVILIFILFVFVAVLNSISHSLFLPKNPIEEVAKAYKAHKYKKAVSLGEKALAKGQPIQIEREILEIIVKCHFDTKNLQKCQEYARKILEKFPENDVAWAYLANSSIASNDTSNEAIAMYEDIYRENPGKLEYLPILAKHYVKTGNTTQEAMEILYTYYKTSERDPEVVEALANSYVKARILSNEAITVLETAIKTNNKPEYKELLARNYSKAGRFEETAKTCVEILETNIENMGIHVVYTSSMKKLNKIQDAIEQYDKFLEKYPNNLQLKEIAAGLKNDSENVSNLSSSASFPDLPNIPEDLPMPDLPEPGSEDYDVQDYLPPEDTIPIPDFLKNESVEPETIEKNAKDEKDIFDLPTFDSIQSQVENKTFEEKKAVEIPADSDWTGLEPAERGPAGDDNLPTLDPFNLSDSFLDEFAADLPVEQLPEEENLSEPGFEPDPDPDPDPDPVKPLPHSPSITNTKGFELEQKIHAAREAAAASNWDSIIDTLSNDYASNRNKDIGDLLIQAWLGKKNPIMAYELVETLDLDPEILSDSMKDLLYKVATALENDKKYKEALKMYDFICNVDINYKDAFDRSDKLYAKLK